MSRSPINAVLFDWRGTLIYDPPFEWWVGAAFDRLGRSAGRSRIDQVCQDLGRAAQLPEVKEGELTADCSSAQHRDWSMRYFKLAGLDDELATSLYDVNLTPLAHCFYPDVADVVNALHERRHQVAVVSDVHYDLRPEFAAAGLSIDAFVLSFEHGIQKPNPKMFELALDALNVKPSEAVMVGDRAARDGGAIAAGILTLLLPPQTPEYGPRDLGAVLRLVD
jgi:HAD superfamily hydrolase (TIGR01509 family)